MPQKEESPTKPEREVKYNIEEEDFEVDDKLETSHLVEDHVEPMDETEEGEVPNKVETPPSSPQPKEFPTKQTPMPPSSFFLSP